MSASPDSAAATDRQQLLTELRWKKFPVLDDGFVCLVDVMGDDSSVVQAARVSYGEGTRKASDDRTLIRYLLRHRHTTPFEMAELKFLVRVPMDCWRQWIRHRTACLAEGTEVYFDLPSGLKRRGNQLYKLAIEDIFRRFQPTRNTQRPDKQQDLWFRRDRVRSMNLRQIDEETLRIQHTRVVDVFRNGVKQVFRVVLADGRQIETTADHRFFFSDGWSTLVSRTGLCELNGKAVWRAGDYYLYVNGGECHRRIHGRELELEFVEQLGGPPVQAAWKKRPRVAWNKLSVAKLVRIERFELSGEKETYDLEVAGPFHNFVANGIVTHNSVNEYSTRYSIAIDSAQTTPVDEWRSQAQNNRQGSDVLLSAEIGEQMTATERELHEHARRVYQERLAAGVAREQARKDLLLSPYTEAYWKIDLHNLLHFLALRMDEHAQLEIREYSATIGRKIVQPLFPLVWEAFEDYRLQSSGLSRLETGVIQRLMQFAAANQRVPPLSVEDFLAVQDPSWRELTRSRERHECLAKLQELGLVASRETQIENC